MTKNNSIMKSKETFLYPIILVLVLLFNIFSCYSKSLVEDDLRDDKLGNHDTIKVSEYIIGTDHDTIFKFVDNPPKYPEGTPELIKYLKANLKYPKIAVKNEAKGRFFVCFVVRKDGSITDVEIAKRPEANCKSKKCEKAYKALEEEAIRVIKDMPNWIPGIQNGKSVSSKYLIPIVFNF